MAREENVYNDKSREDLIEDDEISPEEEGFMKGYEDSEDKDSEEKDEKDQKEKKDEES